jgi:hypothetical protein
VPPPVVAESNRFSSLYDVKGEVPIEVDLHRTKNGWGVMCQSCESCKGVRSQCVKNVSFQCSV